MIHQLHTGDYIDMSKIIAITNKPYLALDDYGRYEVRFNIVMEGNTLMFVSRFPTDEESPIPYYFKDDEGRDRNLEHIGYYYNHENMIFYQNELKNIESLVQTWKNYKEATQTLNTTRK